MSIVARLRRGTNQVQYQYRVFIRLYRTVYSVTVSNVPDMCLMKDTYMGGEKRREKTSKRDEHYHPEYRVVLKQHHPEYRVVLK